MNTKVKFVDFDLFCSKCRHEDVVATEEPCNKCLGTPVREDSHTPINFELNEKRRKGNESE